MYLIVHKKISSTIRSFCGSIARIGSFGCLPTIGFAVVLFVIIVTGKED